MEHSIIQSSRSIQPAVLTKEKMVFPLFCCRCQKMGITEKTLKDTDFLSKYKNIVALQVTASNVTSQDALVSRLAKLTVQGRDINNDPPR